MNWLREKRELVSYLFFGVLTTIVNYIVYLIASRLLGIDYLISNGLAWFFAVLFAYYTNRRWVFQSQATGKVAQGVEFIRFIFGRVLSLVVDMAIMWVGIDLLGLAEYDLWVKTVAQVVVIIMNYVVSKYFVFNKKEELDQSTSRGRK